jgi:hypothetical protein
MVFFERKKDVGTVCLKTNGLLQNLSMAKKRTFRNPTSQTPYSIFIQIYKIQTYEKIMVFEHFMLHWVHLKMSHIENRNV